MADAKRVCRRNRYSIWCQLDQAAVPLSDTAYEHCTTLKECDEAAVADEDDTVINLTSCPVSAAGVELLETLLVVSEMTSIRTETSDDLRLCAETFNLARFLGVTAVEEKLFRLMAEFLRATSVEDLYCVLGFSPENIPVQEIQQTATRLSETTDDNK
jgi:hypothetical protein